MQILRYFDGQEYGAHVSGDAGIRGRIPDLDLSLGCLHVSGDDSAVLLSFPDIGIAGGLVSWCLVVHTACLG